MSSRYGKQLREDAQYRKEWAEKVGLGFDLPPSQPEPKSALLEIHSEIHEEATVAG
jgi:hypothetical protein